MRVVLEQTTPIVSRYVHIPVELTDLSEVAWGLTHLKLAFERGPVTLHGSIECQGEPVLLRLEAGLCDSVEDFGFILVDGKIQLVCGELDQSHLTTELLQPLRTAIAEQRIRAAAQASGLAVKAAHTDAQGRRRLILKRST